MGGHAPPPNSIDSGPPGFRYSPAQLILLVLLLISFKPFRPIDSKWNHINFQNLINAIDNRTDFCNLGKRIYRANSLDKNNRLDKIFSNNTLNAKCITFYQLNCKFRRERVKLLNFKEQTSLITLLVCKSNIVTISVESHIKWFVINHYNYYKYTFN